MPFSAKGFLRKLLAISPNETDFATRGFHEGAPSTRVQLEHCASTFVRGYHMALASSTNALLASELEKIDQDFRGFAYEGSGMALALLDFFFPWNKRFLPFVQNEGNQYIYLLYVGWGWTMGRLPRKQMKRTPRTPYDPLLRWLAYDGYGFHEGFFSWKQTVQRQSRPAPLPKGYPSRAFDQGLGRSLWFVGCGDVPYIADLIQSFPLSRQPDLWSGIGLACAYAGGVSAEALLQIRQMAAPFYPQLAQGLAFAVEARQRAGNLGIHTRLACDTICKVPPEDIIPLVASSLKDLPPEGDEPAFEIWRQRIQAALRVQVASR